MARELKVTPEVDIYKEKMDKDTRSDFQNKNDLKMRELNEKREKF